MIEDDAFIGSDTQLVAPVTIGRGATIGAGSTITKDAPADSLTLSRAKQMTASYKIDGVPMIVVNGKYVSSLSYAGGTDRLLQVVDGLIAQARKETVASK